MTRARRFLSQQRLFYHRELGLVKDGLPVFFVLFVAQIVRIEGAATDIQCSVDKSRS